MYWGLLVPSQLARRGHSIGGRGHMPTLRTQGADEGHLFWECPKVMESRHPAIQKSNRFCAEYSRCKNDPACRTLYWRGLVSEQETTPMAQIFETIEILTPITECCDKNIVVFTDGSGGKNSDDPRLRRCGWALVIPGATTPDCGRCGNLLGPQTVPRAELTALIEFVRELEIPPQNYSGSITFGLQHGGRPLHWG